MNETNRSVIILLAGLWIVLMAVVIFVAWAADKEAVDRLRDFVQYLDEHRDNPSRLILTLGALVLVVLTLLVIILEVAPEAEERELKVEQAGATTIVPAEALRLRLEEALLALPQVTAAKARVFSRDKGIATSLELTITPNANVAAVTQEASRLVADTLQTDLGLPVVGLPAVRIVFGGAKTEPVASSVVQPPAGSSEGLGGPPAETSASPAASEGAPPRAEGAESEGPTPAPEPPAPEPPVEEESPGERPQP